MPDTSIKDFEAAIAELETIVKKLEEGDLALEASLQLYERGVHLSRFCHARLEEAERRIEIEGDRGSILVDAGCRMTLVSGKERTVEDIGAPLLSWTADPWHVSQEGAFGACRHFLACLQRSVPAETSGVDNLSTFALVDAAYRAAQSHRSERPAERGRP